MLKLIIAEVAVLASKHHDRKSRRHNTTSKEYAHHMCMYMYYNEIVQNTLEVINFEIKLKEKVEDDPYD